MRDPTLLHQSDVFQGLRVDGYVLINSRCGFGELGLGVIERGFRCGWRVNLLSTDIGRNLGPHPRDARVKPDFQSGNWALHVARVG